MSTNVRFYVGIDWASESHQVCVIDREGKRLAEFLVEHSAEGMDKLAARLVELGGKLENVAIAIELTRGPIVEGLLERGFAVFGVNPKQLDRYRDRHSPSGAKDDRRDAFVLADALRTDAARLRPLRVDEPVIVELRECSRLHDELQGDLRRLANRLREQLHRYFPQLLKLNAGADQPWLWALLLKAPTPHQARRLRKIQLTKLLREHRIRRFTADELHAVLAQKPLSLAPGSFEAASMHVRSLLPRLRVSLEQLREVERRRHELLEELCEVSEDEPGEHRDAVLLRSLPGMGDNNGATMLSEASQPILERDYHTLRALTGAAPVTRQSGNKRVVLMRRACNPRLRQALYIWALASLRNDQACRAFYRHCRKRGLSHGHALRSLGDRLLRILVAVLRDRTLYDPARHQAVPAA